MLNNRQRLKKNPYERVALLGQMLNKKPPTLESLKKKSDRDRRWMKRENTFLLEAIADFQGSLENFGEGHIMRGLKVKNLLNSKAALIGTLHPSFTYKDLSVAELAIEHLLLLSKGLLKHKIFGDSGEKLSTLTDQMLLASFSSL